MSVNLQIMNNFSRVFASVILSLLIAITSLGSSVTGSSMPASAAPGQRDTQTLTSGIQKALSQSVTNNTLSGNASNSIAYYNWTGYAATDIQPFLQVTTTYVQPTISCPSSGPWTLFWTGFDGYNNGTVEQAGTSAQCIGTNQPDYYAWWEMYPTNMIQVMPITIHAGNTIKDTVTYKPSSGLYVLTVQDLTNKQHFSESIACGTGVTCARTSAEWIAERTETSNGFSPLARWNKLAFTNSEAATTIKSGVNQLLPISSYNNTDITMIGYPDTSTMLASSSSLNLAGKKFTSTWYNAQ